MIFKKFANVRASGDWEWNFIGKRLNLRIGRSQFALWHIDGRPIFNFLYGFHNENNAPRIDVAE